MLSTMNYEFVVRQSKDGQYYFTYRNSRGNTEPICWSENYTTKQACLDAIDKVKYGAGKAPITDLT